MTGPSALAPYSRGGGLAAGAATGDNADGMDWGRYLSALGRFKWLVIGVIVAGFGAAIVAVRVLPRQYTVKSTIWIQQDPGNSGPLRPSAVVDSYAWLQIFNSNRVLDSVAVLERLYLTFPPADSLAFRGFVTEATHKTGEFVLRPSGDSRTWELVDGKGAVLDRAAPGDSLGAHLGFRWLAPARVTDKIAFTVVTRNDAANRLRETLTAKLTDEDGNFLQAELSGSDPVRIARTLNLATERFVEVAAELKRYKLRETSKALEAQMSQMQSRLLSAEGSLERYKTRIITLPTESTPVAAGLTTQPTILTEYFRQKVEVEDVRRDRAALESMLRSAPDSLAVDAILRVPAAQQATELRRSLEAFAKAQDSVRDVRARYTDESRQTLAARDRAEMLRRQAISNLAVVTGALRTAEGEMNGRISSASRELQEIPTRVITEQRLGRDVESISQLYVDVQARLQAARLSEASAVPDVQVLDEAAVPTLPDTSSTGKIAIMIIGASISLALALAILLDRLDSRFRYPTQVTGELGLAILGVVPPIDRSPKGQANADDTMQVIESFRSIRLAIQHAHGDEAQVTFTITSPGPGDGKSLISSNLALSFAEAGFSTLLVDGDIRRGELHRMFNASRQAGLLDVLAGSASLSSALRPTSHARLTLLPCGTRLARGPELLGTPAMRELMASLRSNYQVVIFDSPPLGAGIDPLVLSTVTGAVVLVLRSGETDRHLAEAKLQLMDRLPVRPLGAILNDVQTTGAYKYYNYVYGYTVEAEQEPAALPSSTG